MNPTLRNVLAAIGGIIAFMITVTVIDMVPGWLFTMPAGMDTSDVESIRAHAHEVPAGAIIVMAVGWGLATLVGAYVAGRFGTTPIVVFVVIGVALVATIANLILIPHPVWTWPLGIGLIGAGGFLGLRLSEPKHPTVSAQHDTA